MHKICAHEEVLYEHKTQRSIPDTRFHYKLSIDLVDDEYIYGKNDVFAILIIMKQLLSKEEFNDLIDEISYEVDVLDGKVSVVPIGNILNECGFPDNWKDLQHIE